MAISTYKILTTDWEDLKLRSQNALKDAYDAAAAKGATMPAQSNRTLANLDDCISSIIVKDAYVGGAEGTTLYITGGLIS